MDTYQNIIIGSGPSGSTAAHDIIKFGKQALMLDIGNVLEEENDSIKNEYLNNRNKENFLIQIRKKKKINSDYKNKNLKFPFGSDYVFRKNSFDKINSSENIDFITSNARGGLSNIWGTMVSPFYKKDIDHWDVSYDDFYSELENIEKIIPIVSSDDNLQKFFTINFGKKHNFNLSSNAFDFYSSLNKKSKDLNLNGIYFGRSKLAIGNYYSHEKLACQECGLCHQGCPFDCMYSSDHLLSKITSNHLFEYHNNTYVDKIENQNNINYIYTINIISQKKKIYKTKNIFICAGPISTAAIILRSNLLKNNTVKFKESQRFYLPLIKKKLAKNSINQNKNTLSEIYLEINNKELCDKSIHIQYYTFIDEILRPFEKFFGRFIYILPKIFPFLFGRLNILVGYLNSSYSSEILMTKNFNSNDFLLTCIDNKESKNLINKIINFLKDNIGKDFLFLKFLTNINLVGSSYHYGSSFPMSKDNKNNERSTSTVGELSGYSNIYILDASILPDMPASPTTLNVCINASRIIKKLSIEGKI